MFEGFLQLSQAVLDIFCSDGSLTCMVVYINVTVSNSIVLEENCLEFCDYLFGLFLKLASKVLDHCT